MYNIPLILVILTIAAGQKLADTDAGSFDNLVEAKDSKSKGDCLIWYAESITGEITTIPEDGKASVSTFVVPTKAPQGVECSTGPGKMGNTNVTKITIPYSNESTKTDVTLKLVFTTYNGGYWELQDSESSVTVKSNEMLEFNLTDNDVYANHEFSFSCGEMMLNTRDVKQGKTLYKLNLSIHRLQVQPYPPKTQNLVFHDSFDCSTWFTIPLWSGLAVSTLLTSILAMGVYALLMIKTPDRFESVKSKPLLIATSD